MSSKSAKEVEEFARDCVRLAEQADTPELREKLLNLAREWMRSVMTTSPERADHALWQEWLVAERDEAGDQLRSVEHLELGD